MGPRIEARSAPKPRRFPNRRIGHPPPAPSRAPARSMRRSSAPACQLGARAFDRLTHDVLDVARVDAQRVADVHRPDLRAEVRLEVELATDVGPRRLAVLADHDERREEDVLEADDHRQQSERELVELERGTRTPTFRRTQMPNQTEWM